MEADRAKRRLSGGFWRRMIAGLIDVLTVCALVSAVGVLAYGPSAGRVRIAAPLYSEISCTVQARDPRRPDVAPALPPGAIPTEGFRVDSVALCTRSLFGQTFDRSARVTMASTWSPGNGVKFHSARTLDYPLDSKGRATTAVYIDWVEGPAVILVLALMEGLFAAGLGKALLGLKVLRRHGYRASLTRALVRNILLYGWWAVLGVGGLFVRDTIRPAAWAIWGGATVWFLVVGVSLVFTRPSPFHDIWSGLKVSKR